MPSRSRATDHGPRHRIQAFHRRADPLDGASGNAARVSPAEEAREQGDIPWDWIVDETRDIERVATWDDPEDYARASRDPIAATSGISSPSASRSGARKAPSAACLVRYSTIMLSASARARIQRRDHVYDVSQDDDGRELIVLYVGDFDPSGMFMSEEDLPDRFSKYEGDHVELETDCPHGRDTWIGLPSFPATDKRTDPATNGSHRTYGDRCWELDAMDPNDLRNCVEQEIVDLIEPVAWKRCEVVNKAGGESLKTILGNWGKR